MVRNVKCQLVKSSKHKHENVVKPDRLSACVCVHVCVCDCDLVSVGVVDVFRGQRWDHRRFSLTLDVHRQHHWLGRETNVLNGARFHLRCRDYSRASVFSGSCHRGVSTEVAFLPSPPPEAAPLALQQVTISHLDWWLKCNKWKLAVTEVTKKHSAVLN